MVRLLSPSSLGIAAVVVDVAAITALSILSSADAIHDYVSTLGVPGAWTAPWYIAAGTIAAPMHLAFVAGLWRRTSGPLHHGSAALLALFFILHWLGAAVWPCDPGCALTTTTARIHYGLGVAAFVSLGLATIGYAVMGVGRPAAITAVACAVVLLVFDQLQLWRGLFERITMAAFGVWWVIAAWRLRAIDPGTGHHPTPEGKNVTGSR